MWSKIKFSFMILVILSSACSKDGSQEEESQIPAVPTAPAALEQAQAPVAEGDDPVLRITSPSPTAQPPYILMGAQATPVEVSFSVSGWGSYPAEGKSAQCFLDGGRLVEGQIQLGEIQGETTGTSFEFPDVPLGQHQLCCSLAMDGTPLAACDATMCVTVRITRSCTQADVSVCDDGNPCSVQSCSGGHCAYGFPIGEECCLSRFDCGCTEGVWQLCDSGSNQCLDCLADGDCDDQEDCTIDSCQSGECQNVWLVDSHGAKCCHAGDDSACNDHNICTSDFCDAETGFCVNAVSPGSDCCNSDLDCDDDNLCTLDRCVGHTCRHGEVIGQDCCTESSDCNDGNPCTDDSCDPLTRRCVFSENDTQGCCSSHVDCSSGGVWDDGDLSTLDFCAGHLCVHQPKPDFCDDSGEHPCLDDGNPCTVDACVDNSCTHAKIPGCCNIPSDCNDQNACTSDRCVDGQCTHGEVANCCQNDLACDDSNPCTVDKCVNHLCRNGWNIHLPDCCLQDSDCSDGSSCTNEFCDTQVNNCVRSLAQEQDGGCCFTAVECDDGNPGTVDTCLNNRCTHQVDSTNCNGKNTLCDDMNPCTVDTCDQRTGKCSHVNIQGCCLDDVTCRQPGFTDGNPCTTDRCDLRNHQCSFTPVSECCTSSGDCDDGNACTTDTCLNSSCRHAPKAGCCLGNQDCEDGNACTLNTCQKASSSDLIGVCVSAINYTSAECCGSVADCNDGDPCTKDLCINNECRHGPELSCCVSDADCQDSNLCTCDRCIQGMCRHIPPQHAGPECGLPPLCCMTASDCASDHNSCTDDLCLNNLCAYVPKESCSQPLPYIESFNNAAGIQEIGWSILGDRLDIQNWGIVFDNELGPDRHLEFGWSPWISSAFESFIITPPVTRGSASKVTVQFERVYAHFQNEMSLVVGMIRDDASPRGLLNSADTFIELESIAASESLPFELVHLTFNAPQDDFGVAFKVAGANSYFLNYLDIDNFRMCPGTPPRVSGVPEDLAVPMGRPTQVAITLSDEDGDNLQVSVLHAPEFVALDTSVAGVVRLIASPSIGAESGEQELEFQVTDGCLTTRVRVNLHVFVDRSFLVWAPQNVSALLGQVIADAVEANGRSVQVTDSLAGYDLTSFDGLLVTLGGWGLAQHEFSSDELAALLTYIDNGGRVYLEGGDAWDRAALLSRFKIERLSEGEAAYTGQASGRHFLWGRNFDVRSSGGLNRSLDILGSELGSFAIPVLVGSDHLALAIAYEDEQAGYRTIGSSVAFMALEETVEGGADELMEQVLIFLESGYPGCTADAFCQDSLPCRGPDSCVNGLCVNAAIEDCVPCRDDRNCGDDQACAFGVCVDIPGVRHDSVGALQEISDSAPGTYTSSINLTSQDNVVRASLKVAISHSFRGDLKLSLAHGTKNLLLRDEDRSDGGDGIFQTYDVGVPSAGEEGMAGFAGLTAGGSWVLTVQDRYPMDGGQILGWSLFLDEEAVPCASADDCDDGNACTVDECVGGGCSYSDLECADLYDGQPNLCTEDTCIVEVGCVNVPNDCDDGSPCTLDTCEPGSGSCSNDLLSHCMSECTGHRDCGLDDYCGEGECKLIPFTAYHSAGAPVTITDSGEIQSEILVPDEGVVRDLHVKVRIDHPFRGDLIVTLMKGDSSVVLHQRTGGALDDLWMVYDIADAPREHDGLDAFTGASAAGAWLLKVSDNREGDVGTLLGWSLHLDACQGAGDNDGDGIADCLDPDDDGDGFPDDVDCQPLDSEINPGVEETCNGRDDNCDSVVDEDYPDSDSDDIKDCLDSDDDNDGVLDPDDNCPLAANPSQDDTDQDGLGDACDEVDDSIPLGPIPIAIWSFEDGEGCFAMETFGVSHGILRPDCGSDMPQWTEGIVGGALRFDGIHDYVYIANEAPLNPTNGISVAAWVKWEVNPGDGDSRACIVEKNLSNQFRLAHFAQNRAFEFTVKTTHGKEILVGNAVPQEGTWHLVVGTYDGHTVKLYVDGELDASSVRVGELVTSDSEILIGRAQGNSKYFHGLIDEVTLWSGAISADDVRLLYQAIH